MSLLDTVIFALFKDTIFGYGIVGYGVYQITKRLLPKYPKLPSILTFISIVLSFWYLPSLPIKHWRSNLNFNIQKYENYSNVNDGYSEISFLTPVEILHGWGDKTNHLLERVVFKYPSNTPVERELLDVDCNENTIEISIIKNKSYDPSLQKLNSFGKEVLDGEYYTPKNSSRKMLPLEIKSYCEYDWSIKKENIIKEQNHKN
jgi:hypothetical protein